MEVSDGSVLLEKAVDVTPSLSLVKMKKQYFELLDFTIIIHPSFIKHEMVFILKLNKSYYDNQTY